MAHPMKRSTSRSMQSATTRARITAPRRAPAAILAVAGLSLTLAACNAGPLLQTGSLTPTATSAAPAAPAAPATAMDRTLHVAATSARAQKCGYFFDPNALRTNYLAAEAQRGTPADALAKLGPAYDYTQRTIAGKIATSDTYCADNARTAEIKSSLQKMLAGDFEAPPPKREEPSGGGLFAAFEPIETGEEKFNADHIYDPLLNENATKRAEPE